MPQPSALVTAAEISRIAGVTRATVSNWRRRHDDFPTPSAGTDSSPLYDLEAVRSWLAARGHTSAASPSEELRTTLRLHAQDSGSGTSDLLLLVLAAGRRSPDDLTAFTELSDADLVRGAAVAVAGLSDAVPGTDAVRFRAGDAAVLRALLLCVRDEGGEAALGVLAERELEDSAAGGTYRTPGPLADLAARLLPGSPARVLDPACGSGSLLTAAARRKASELYGQDSLPVQARRSAVTLMLTAPDTGVTVRSGDSLRADAFPGLLVDAVLCNPPYGDRDWGHDELAYDPRWAYGVPARGESELAWVQHALAHLESGGHAILILPPATAGRASGRRVRRELVRSGALRAVVALPAGAAPPLHISLQIWVLQRPEPGGPERKSVLFVDTATGGSGRGSSASGSSGSGAAAGAGAGSASGAGSGRGSVSSARTRSGGRAAALDWATVTEETLAAWEAFVRDPDGFTDEPGLARAVPVVDLLDDVADLTPARQVRVTRQDVAPDALAAELATARSELLSSTRSFTRAARDTDFVSEGASNAEWRTATASDLARGGALTLLRTTPEAGGEGDVEPRAVLTASDIQQGTGPTGDPAELRGGSAPVVAEGDVLVRAIAGGEGAMARVADEQDAGALLGPGLHLLRPDPKRLDAWCLAGFLGSEDNIAGASTGSTVLQVSPGRLRVPLLPLTVQQQYGKAFRRLHELRAEALRAALLADDTARLLASGLTGGQFIPFGETAGDPSSNLDSDPKGDDSPQ